MPQEFIEIRGARENNLKNVSLRIPKRKITIFTGVSGSGKSSIVFDTIANEALRLLNENFSLFIRNFLRHGSDGRSRCGSARGGLRSCWCGCARRSWRYRTRIRRRGASGRCVGGSRAGSDHQFRRVGAFLRGVICIIRRGGRYSPAVGAIARHQ